MKTTIKTLSIIFIISSLLFAFTACSNSASTEDDEDGEEGTFTISLGESIRAAYPPKDSPAGNIDASAPLLADLEFKLTFTEVGGSRVETFTFDGGEEITGSIHVGTYMVAMEVFWLSAPYATGAAVSNPVTIASGNNSDITVQLSPVVVSVRMPDNTVIFFNSLKTALDSIYSHGNYRVQLLSTPQSLEPYTFLGNAVRSAD